MTERNDSTEKQEEEMDPRFENLAGYVLNALDHDEERTAVEALIESDSAVQAELNELAEAAEMLALAVPPAVPPTRLKAQILEQAANEPLPQVARLTPFITAPKPPWWTGIFRSGYAASAVAAVIVIVVTGAFGFQNNRLVDEIDSLRTELQTESVAVANLRSELSTTMTDSETEVASMKNEMDQMETEFDSTVAQVVHQEEMVSELAVANTALQQALQDQSWLTYVAMKEGYQVESWLADDRTSSTSTPEEVSAAASGLIAIRAVGNEAVFQVHGLEQPQPGHIYTLWLLGNGEPTAVSQFEVSEIGSATLVFLLPAPFYLYSSAAVTQERIDNIGLNPSDTMILSAETR